MKSFQKKILCQKEEEFIDATQQSDVKYGGIMGRLIFINQNVFLQVFKLTCDMAQSWAD